MANVKFLTGTETNLLKKNSDGSYINPIVEGSLYVTAEKVSGVWVSNLYYDINGQRIKVADTSGKAMYDHMNNNIAQTYIKKITMEGTKYASTDGATLTYTTGDNVETTILLPLASTTKAGTVNTGAQTFAGNKTFMGQVILQGGTDTAAGTANSGALIIGSPTGAHISVDANEIQAKSSGTASAQLHINNDGGITQFGGNVQPKADNTLSLGTEKLRWKTIEAVTINATTFNGALNGNVKGNLDGNAATADKWYTARTITLGSDLQGSVSIDGSKNVTLNAQHYNVSCSSSNKSNYPWHRIATTGAITSTNADRDMTIVIRHSYNGGGYGVAKVSLRTNSGTSVATASVKWLYRYNIEKNSLQIGLRNTAGNALADLYYKVGTWARATIYQVEGARSWTLIASSEVSDTTSTDKKTSKEVYTSVSNGNTLLAANYTSTIEAIDCATVQNANYASTADGAITDNANHAILTHYLSKIDFDGTTNKATKVVVNLYNGSGAIKTTVDFPTASASQAGAITTGTQTLTGAKTLDANGSLVIQKSNGFNYSGIGTASDAVARHVWFSHSSNKGTPILSDKFKYNPASTDKWATVVANATDKTSAAYGKLIVDVLEGIAARAYADDRGQQISKKYVASLSFDGTTNKASKVTMTYNDGTGAEIATVNFPTASASSAGAITTGTQTLTGAKTLDANGSLTIQKASGFNYSGIESASSDSARHVWFSHASNVGTPVKNDKFKLNPGATDTWATVVANATDKTGSAYSKLIVNVVEGIAARAYADDRGQKISTKYVATMAFSGTGSTVTLTYRDGAGADIGTTNIPVAGSSAAGIVTNTTQTIAGNKTFTGRVYIKNSSDAALGTADGGALVIGDKAGEHIIIDSNEIMGKATGTTSRELLFQWDGGNAGFGGMILPKTNKTSSVGSSSRRWNEMFAYIFNAATKFTTGGGTFYADSDGNAYFANSVGIRTNPDDAYALKVAGNSWFVNDVYTDAPIHIGETTAANAILYLNKKIALRGIDSWLRINDTGAFTSGSYFGSTLVRTDGQFQVGSGGSKFYANSSGNGYFSNTLGIAGTNTNHKLYVNGSTLHNGYVYFANGNIYFVDNSGQGKFNRLNVGYSGTTFDTGYTVKVNGTGYFENTLRVNNHIYGSLADNKIDITVDGDANTYYPVVITSNPTTSYAGTIFSITRGYSEKAPDTWNTATHRGGLTLTLLWNGSRYWDGNGAGGFSPNITNILQHYESYCTMVAGLDSATTGLVVWLRGGGAVYHIYSQRGTLLTASVKMTAYTDDASRTFSPKTSVDTNNLNPKRHWVLRGGDTMLGTLNTQHIYPKTDNTYNAGSSSMRYKEIHGYTIFAHTKFQNPAGSFYADKDGRMYVQNGTGLGIAPDTAGTYILKVKGNSLFNGILYLANGTTYYIDNSAQAKIRGIIGNLYMRTSGSSIHWDDGNYQQRIATTDDSTANTNVFMFQQSADSGSTWTNLLKIRDNGVVDLLNNTGQLRKYYSASNTTPAIMIGSNNLNINAIRIGHTSDGESWSTGYTIKYLGASDGVNNRLELWCDGNGAANNAGTEQIGISVNQGGYVGIGVAAQTAYRLYVNGPSYLNGITNIVNGQEASSATTGTLRVTGGISVSANSWFGGSLTIGGNVTVSGYVNAAKGFGVNATAGDGRGIDLYGGTNGTTPDYGIMFAKTATFGTLGGVTSDWATYFTMSNTNNRGWIFRRGTSGTTAGTHNVFSIDTYGKLYSHWAAAVDVYHRVKNSLRDVGILTAASGNAGLYDYTRAVWLIYTRHSDGQTELHNNTYTKHLYPVAGNTYDIGGSGVAYHYRAMYSRRYNVYDSTGSQVWTSYIQTTGTTSAVGNADTVLGNSIASGTAGNSRGRLVIYGTGAYYSLFQTNAASSHKTVTIPNYAGYMVIGNNGDTNPTSRTEYRVPFYLNNYQRLGSNDGIRYFTLQGTTSALGYGDIVLGNATASGTAGNKRGRLFLYGSSTAYTEVITNVGTSSTTATIPAYTGFTVIGQNGYTNPTSGTTYYVPFYNVIHQRQSANDGFRYLTLQGTTSAAGYGYLVLGNATATGTAGNKYGALRMYNQKAGWAQIIPGTNDASGYTLYLPGANGQLIYHNNDTAVGGTATPVYINASGQAVACSYGVGTSHNTLAKTTKFYFLGTTLTATGYQTTSYFDTGIFATTTSGQMSAGSIISRGSLYAGTNLYLRNGESGTYARLFVNTVGTAGDGTNAGTTGDARLYLGNATAVTTTSGSGANNARGRLLIYGTNTGYTQIMCGTNNTSGYTIYLPGANGQFVIHTNDTAVGNSTTPVYVNAAGQVVACSKAFGSYLPLAGGTMTGQIKRATNGGTWISGRDNALLRNTSSTSGSAFAPIISAKTQGGSWDIGPCHPNTHLYFSYATDTNYNAGTNSTQTSIYFTTAGYIYATRVYKAVWNDYAEFREAKIEEPGRVVIEGKFGIMELSTKRLQPGGNIVSDTYGDAMGQTEKCNTPIAIAGRVLAYPYEDIESYELGDAVCTGPHGTVSKMSREEIREWPDRIIGTVSEIPSYETWGTGNIKVNGRIWIKVK